MVLAGVKERDEVLEVDGVDVSMLRVQDVRKLLLGPPGSYLYSVLHHILFIYDLLSLQSFLAHLPSPLLPAPFICLQA